MTQKADVIAELKGVSKAFVNKAALNNIDLEIYDGEILALLGPNGSGKSTLLKILAFLDFPTTGEVSFQKTVASPKNSGNLRKQSSLVFQKTALFEGSVFDNVSYGLKIRKVPKNRQAEAVREALRIVKLEGFEKRAAKSLSGGEQQRVAIARALVLKTKLLLLDEPTANLDPKNAKIVEEVIATLNREQKTTIILATHNMFQAEILPSRIALINNGGITEIGTPEEIFGKLSRNLASFAVVDNSFKGNAEASTQGTTIVDIGNGVHVEVIDRRTGEASIFVSPQDIILSKNAIQSSARNVFKGKITGISDLNSLVKLKVDVGVPFTVQITKRSFVEMGLNLGSDVYIAFKASSVSVF